MSIGHVSVGELSVRGSARERIFMSGMGPLGMSPSGLRPSGMYPSRKCPSGKCPGIVFVFRCLC